jgi:hypothetical protein
MRCFLIILFLFTKFNICEGQIGFKTTLVLDKTESNDAFQCIAIDSTYYFSGGYFDKLIGRWTVYFASVNNVGEINLLGTEKFDTIETSNMSNKMVVDNEGLYILGLFRKTNLLLHYNFSLDSIWVIEKFDLRKIDFNGFGLSIDKSSNFVLSGQTLLGNDIDSDIKVISFKDSILNSFIDGDPTKYSGNSIPLIAPNGNIYLPCFDFSGDDKVNDRAYIICLDSNLNKIFSTKNTANEISLKFAKGALIDNQGNIIISGYDRRPLGNKIELVPQVAKFDKNGKPLWKVDAGKPNVNNFFGWGSWQNIIEAQEGDGYILAGSHFEGSYSEDQELGDAALAKISTYGTNLWTKTYTFRNGTNRVFCLFWDIIATSDGGYFAVGSSLNASVPTSLLPDPPGFQSIILKTDKNGNFMADTTSTIDVSSGDSRLLVNVYPNPASDQVHISQTGDSKLNIRIIDSHGRLMDTFDCIDKDHNILINTSNWAPGMYYASFSQNGEELGCRPFVIVR